MSEEQELYNSLARQALGADWDINPFIQIGLGREFLDLKLEGDDLRKFVNQYIRLGLRHWHSDVAQQTTLRDKNARVFAVVSDLLDKPRVFDLAWREFRRSMVGGSQTSELQDVRLELQETKERLKSAQEEAQVLNAALTKAKGDYVDKEWVLRQDFEHRLTTLVSGPALSLSQKNMPLAAPRERITRLITLHFHVAWGKAKKAESPIAIVNRALSSKEIFPRVQFNADPSSQDTLKRKTAESFEQDHDIQADSPLSTLYHKCLRDLGSLLYRNKPEVLTFTAEPRIMLVANGAAGFQLPAQARPRHRVLLGSLPLEKPGTPMHYFRTSRRLDEVELVHTAVVYNVDPWVIEGRLLVTANMKELLPGVDPLRELEYATGKTTFYAHEVVLRIFT